MCLSILFIIHCWIPPEVRSQKGTGDVFNYFSTSVIVTDRGWVKLNLFTVVHSFNAGIMSRQCRNCWEIWKYRMCTTDSRPRVFHQRRWTTRDLFKAPKQHDLITLYPKESCSWPRRVWILQGFQQTWPHRVPRHAIPNINMMLIWFNRTPKQYEPTSKIKEDRNEIKTLCRSETNVGKLAQSYATYLTLH